MSCVCVLAPAPSQPSGGVSYTSEKGGREGGVSQATQQQRISIRFHHGLDVKHVSAEVFGSSPRWRQKDHVTAETGRQLEEIPLHKVNPVSNVVNSSVVLRQVQPICIYVNRQYCKQTKKKGWGGDIDRTES